MTMATELLAAAAGGVAGALVIRWLDRLGVRGDVAAIGVATAGGVAAALTDGPVQAFASGVTAIGAGQLSRIWFGALERQVAADASGAHERRQATAEPASYDELRGESFDWDAATRKVEAELDALARAQWQARTRREAASAAPAADAQVSGQPDTRPAVPDVPDGCEVADAA